MTGRRRGRTGRGWDAAPLRARRTSARPPGSAEPGPAPAEPAAADPAERAREICLGLLAARPRTRAELATALRKRGIEDRVAAEVLERYDQVGLIDDAAFARAWVTSRHHGRGLARRALGAELRRRGVAPDAVGEALGELDPDTETETARALVERRLRTATGSPEVIVRRLVGMLARKGYPAGLAYRVVKEALADDERTAELADRLDPDALADAAGPEPEPPGPEPEPPGPEPPADAAGPSADPAAPGPGSHAR